MEQDRSDLRRVLAYVAPYWRRLVLVLVLREQCPLRDRPVALHPVPVQAPRRFRAPGARPERPCAYYGALRRHHGGLLRHQPAGQGRVTSSAAYGIRVFRPISCSTCGWSSTGTCSGCRPVSTPARPWARSCRGSPSSRLINSDISEIQRVASETALAWLGNVIFLVGTVAMLALARRPTLPGVSLAERVLVLSLITMPPSLWPLRYGALPASRRPPSH